MNTESQQQNLNSIEIPMSIRDMFAMQVIGNMKSIEYYDDYEYLFKSANLAYKMADIMIAVRAQKYINND